MDRNLPHLVRTKELAALFPAINPRTLRYWIQGAAPREVSENGVARVIPGNGLGRAVIRKGGIVLIDLDLFTEWLYEGRLSA